MMLVNGKTYRSVWWDNGVVQLVDQRVLPHRFEILACRTYRDTTEAIRSMVVRGAGAIGATAGYAMAQAALSVPESTFAAAIEEAAAHIRAARPTAVDLFYAVDQVRQACLSQPSAAQARAAAVRMAGLLADANAAAGEAIGRIGVSLLRPNMRIMTHCNTGWLAFADWGSALAPIYVAHRSRMPVFVYVMETRPRSQGAKLTAWELAQEGVPHVILADTASGSFMRRGEVDCVIVGADRIAANGDTANKIGTYNLAVLARHHDIPFYVAAPRSTFDLRTPTGASIPIEERDAEEVLYVTGQTADGRLERVRMAAPDSSARNPAFDVTPAELITSFITESGVIAPRQDAIAKLLDGYRAAVAAS